MSRRDALSLLPPCAMTGVGSLPLSLAEALHVSLQQDVPYLPEVAGELMLPLALSSELPPSLEPFIGALQLRGARFAKAQLAGPATVTAFSDRREGVVEHLAAKAVAMTRELLAAKVTPIIFLDEPGLGMAPLPVDALEAVRRAASEAGAIVGLHCCGQTRWGELLGLGFDLIGLDARLSLDALLEDRRAWLRFVEAGGTLCLGIIPTNASAKYDVNERCDSVAASLRASTPNFQRVLSRLLLSPACGLGLHSVEDAARISAELLSAQARLRALL
ncbi:MAG: hypothetical protein Q8N23_14240 [Archangium sp.]|nr:hypothetical protein [Archangium sp.]MDP3569945.1 hypothetical protein [Archangium sp.]